MAATPGDVLWEGSFGDASADVATGIAYLSDGSQVVVGSFRGIELCDGRFYLVDLGGGAGGDPELGGLGGWGGAPNVGCAGGHGGHGGHGGPGGGGAGGPSIGLAFTGDKPTISDADITVTDTPAPGGPGGFDNLYRNPGADGVVIPQQEF